MFEKNIAISRREMVPNSKTRDHAISPNRFLRASSIYEEKYDDVRLDDIKMHFFADGSVKIIRKIIIRKIIVECHLDQMKDTVHRGHISSNFY